jgi:hypothetical protein
MFILSIESDCTLVAIHPQGPVSLGRKGSYVSLLAQLSNTMPFLDPLRTRLQPCGSKIDQVITPR